jgi:hypothetical protein
MPVGNINTPGLNMLTPLTLEELKQSPKHPGAVKIDYPPDAFGHTAQDSQEPQKKKGSFLGKVTKTIVALVAISAGLIYAGRKGKFDVSKELVEPKLLDRAKGYLKIAADKLDELYKPISEKAQKYWTVIKAKVQKTDVAGVETAVIQE